MKERIKAYLEEASERIRSLKESVTRQKIMNILGVYVDEETEEDVRYDNALQEIFYDFLLWLYGYEEGGEECEQ